MATFYRILILCIGFAFSLSAQAINKEPSQKSPKILWIVDEVELNDSILNYSLEQMRSDSAAILAREALNWVYPGNIKSISVMDSVIVAENGFINCNGVVKIATKFRETLLVVINGYIYVSKEMASAGEILGGYDRIQHIVQNKFPGIEEYGIIESKVLKQMNIGCHPQMRPIVIITTELPYYRPDIFEGEYLGKRGKRSYELTLKADSTYNFQKKIIHKKDTVHEIDNFGTWEITDDDIILNPSQDHNREPQDLSGSLKAVSLKINSAKILTLPKGIWDNKKSVTLKRK